MANRNINYDRIFLFGALCTNKWFAVINIKKRTQLEYLAILLMDLILRVKQ
jgi:hypothetical protein